MSAKAYRVSWAGYEDTGELGYFCSRQKANECVVLNEILLGQRTPGGDTYRKFGVDEIEIDIEGGWTGSMPWDGVQLRPVRALVPLQLTQGMIQAIKSNPLTSVEDKDEWHKRLGWLICAYEVLVEAAKHEVE